MPTPLIKALAKKSGKTEDQVDQAWHEAKKAADQRMERKNPAYWGLVTKITKAAIGLHESKSFKGFIQEQDELASAAPHIYNLACALFWMRDAAHALHLQTHSYAAHMALDELYTSIGDKMDQVIEALQGYGGLLPMIHPQKPIELPDTNQPLGFVASTYYWLDSIGRSMLPDSETVKNLYDELLAGFLSARYKLENLVA